MTSYLYIKLILIAFVVIALEFFYIVICNSFNHCKIKDINVLKENFFGFSWYFTAITYYMLVYENYIFSDNITLGFEEISRTTVNELYINFTKNENLIFDHIMLSDSMDDPVLDNIISILNYGNCSENYYKESLDKYCDSLSNNKSLNIEVSNLTEGINRLVNDFEQLNIKKMFEENSNTSTIEEIINYYLARTIYYKEMTFNNNIFVGDISLSFSDIIKPSLISLIAKIIDDSLNVNLALFCIFIVVLFVKFFISLVYYHRVITNEIIQLKSFLFIIKYEDIVEIPSILDYLNTEMILDDN